jgi:hypothetical protein
MRRGRGDRLSLTISAKPDGVGAACQRLIPTGKRSGLLTHSAAKIFTRGDFVKVWSLRRMVRNHGVALGHKATEIL